MIKSFGQYINDSNDSFNQLMTNKRFVYNTYKCDQLDGLVKLLKDNLL